MDIDLARSILLACHRAQKLEKIMPTLPTGISPRHVRIINAVITLEKMAGSPALISEVADELEVTRPSITRSIKELEKLGYLTKASGQDDGRKVTVSVTPLGLKFHKIYDLEFHRQIADTISEISEENLKTTLETLAQLHQSLENIHFSLNIDQIEKDHA